MLASGDLCETMEPPRQAVEAVGEEDHPHRNNQQMRGSCSPDSQSTMRAPPNPVVICDPLYVAN